MAHSSIVQESDSSWFGQLNALSKDKNAIGLNSFLSQVARSGQKAAWHSARQRFVHDAWKKEDLDALGWLRQEMGPELWTGLTVPAAWTLDTLDGAYSTRRQWHNEMLTHNDSRGVFKNDARNIEIVEGQPKLSWLIAAMQAAKPKAYPALDQYFPGAFAYFEVLQMTGENPMDNAAFKDWILLNKHPGFNENLGDVEGQDLFGSPG